ncbi:unnamed protein product [Brassica napus]|uniref:(rape) hypothetical protein n=1 Tax=Brassica napus TaxID=3708 RepID=A0A816JDJ9_BRANA|nr:unnamed protein product [Brassica napus]
MKGQADTIGIAMRRALLGEIEGTCITCAKSENIPHDYSNIVGIQESGIFGKCKTMQDSVFEAVVKIPYDMQLKKVLANGKKGALNVGAVLILPEGFEKIHPR